jgi:N-acetylglucosaminyl-diphospho-decaprenol L-rhamnosyltransferase
MSDLSVVIVNWNTCQMLADCLDSIEATVQDLALEVIVVDNGSTDGSQAMVNERYPHVCLIQNEENVGFARANNQAVSVSMGSYALLLNSDAVLLDGAVQAMIDLAETKPRVGIVGAHLLNPDGSFQASHSPFPNLWQEFLILSGVGRMFLGRWYPSRGPDVDRGARKVDYVEGACLLVRREAYAEAGGLDEGYFMYAEEVDLCYTMRERGWQVWYQPAARVIHVGSGSSGNRRTKREADLYRSRVRFFRRHYGDRAARLLRVQILGFTAVKCVVHGLLARISGGRHGRPIVPLPDLAAQLRDV